MTIQPSKIKKILVITLSNIGDVVLTFPVIDILKEGFPLAKISVVVGPKAASMFLDSPVFDQVHVYNKHQFFLKTGSWVMQMRKEKYDLVIDLRNTAIPFFLGAKYRTLFKDNKLKTLHMKEKHLNRLKEALPDVNLAAKRHCLSLNAKDHDLVDTFLFEGGIGKDSKFVAVAPGAADKYKRWNAESFAALCDHLQKDYGLKIVFAGSSEDKAVADKIGQLMKTSSVNICGKTSLLQLAQLIRRSVLFIGNDSAPMHIASYLNKPTLAIFGPTDPKKYGPWSVVSCYVQGNLSELKAEEVFLKASSLMSV